MQATRLTSSTHEESVSVINGRTVQRTRWWETAYTGINWDYPPSPAAYYDALLSRGASHSRFLRIAYLSTRERFSTPAPPFPTVSRSRTSTVSPLDTSTTPTSPLTPAYLTSTTSSTGSPRKPAVRLPPIPPYPLSRPCMNVRPRFANPTSHVLKRRKSQWLKPPHYHASLLRSPLSRRKGLFRAVLPPNQAVDFFRWDIFLGGDLSLATPCQQRDRTRSSGVDACASLLVAESVLEPYEAAAGFFGWHGLGLDRVRRVEGNGDEGVEDECCWSERMEVCQLGLERDGAGVSRSPDLQLRIDEAVVEDGRARWARTAEELVGPPGLALPWVVEDGGSGKVTMHSASAHKNVVDSRAPSSIFSRREEVRWDVDVDVDSSPFRPSRPPSTFDEKRQLHRSRSMATVPGPSSSSKPELKTDSPSGWWYGPSPHRGPPPTPRLPSLHFPPPPSVQYGPPLQFSPWFPPGRVASAQGHGYWYSAQPTGAPSVNRDPNLPNSLPPPSHVFAIPVTPTSMHPSQSPRYPIKQSFGRGEYGPGHDCDKEAETDHGYESTTTTTDSDPPPYTPVGAATTSHCVEALQIHGDDEAEVHGVEIDSEHAAASVSIGLSDPATPVKLLGRFSMSTSPSVPGYDRDGYGSSKTAVVFPSLNGSFRQGSLPQMPVSLSSRGISTQTTPGRTVTPVSSSSLSSAKESTTRLGLGVEDNSKIKPKSGGACSVSGDSPAFMLSLCSPPPMSPSPGLRKDSQGFWEPATPISPSSSSSSLPLSPSEGKMRSRPTVGRISEKTGPVRRESSDSSEAAGSQFTISAKSRSLSPGPRRVTSAGSNRSSSSIPASFSSPTSTPASTSVLGGSYPSSPSPTNSSSLVTPNPTTLLPAFLATATVKRKKASRTREIVDRLRSSSIDAGKGSVGMDSSGWLAGPSAGGEQDGTLNKASSASDHAGGINAAGGQPSPSPPSKSSSDSSPWLKSDLGKNHSQVSGSKSVNSGSSGSGGKSNGATQVAVPGSETLFSLASAGTVTTTGNPSITPFPILSVSQSPASNSTSQIGGIHGREPVTATASNGGDGSRVNATVVTPPNTRSSGSQLLPSTPNGGTSPSTHHPPHPLPSPSHPTVHPQPPLGPPLPMFAVSPYPHSMYVPFTQYHLAPPHQGQQGQGTWLAVYPGRPPHLPVHPLPAQTHVTSVTGVSGMRHVSW